jgi:hypothetical protein
MLNVGLMLLLLAGAGVLALAQVVTGRDTLVYYHTPQELYRYQAGVDETLGVWFSSPNRTRPYTFKATRFIAYDPANSDSVHGWVKLVPRHTQGGQPLLNTGTPLKRFAFQTGAPGETTSVTFNPPLATDPERDFLVCWASRVRRVWPIDSAASWNPPRSYRVRKDSLPRMAPLGGDLAVIGVFAVSETVDVQVDAINAPTGQVLQGTTVTPQAVVRNNGKHPATFPVRFRIGAAYMDSVRVSGLAPGSAYQVSFRPWIADQLGTFRDSCATYLPGDMVPANDLRVGSVEVVAPDTTGFGIELIWKDGRADLDLYLLLPRAPGDTIVDTVGWFRRQARGCTLDVDDTYGYGPEKIRGPIGALMPDTAKVGVHYYGPPKGVSTQARIFFYRNRVKVDSTKWFALSPGNWSTVGFPDLRAGSPGFLAKPSVLKKVKGLYLKK